MILTPKRTKLFFCGLVLLSLMSFAEIAYYQLKANVAQVFLEKAWQDSQKNPDLNIKPWPWADTWPVLKLSLIRKRSDKSYMKTDSQHIKEYIVLADVSGESLAFGPGLMTPGILPGSAGNSFLAAHRDTHFSELAMLGKNDEMLVEYKNGSVYRFVIDQIKVVDSQKEKPLIEYDEARLTLVTCYPFDMSVQQTPLRLLVSGRKI